MGRRLSGSLNVNPHNTEENVFLQFEVITLHFPPVPTVSLNLREMRNCHTVQVSWLHWFEHESPTLIASRGPPGQEQGLHILSTPLLMQCVEQDAHSKEDLQICHGETSSLRQPQFFLKGERRRSPDTIVSGPYPLDPGISPDLPD